MEMHWHAYGMGVSSSFTLSGVDPVECCSGEERPADLTMTLISEQALERRWDALGEQLEWTGLLGDGEQLTIHSAPGGGALFTYGSRARFLLSADLRELACCPQQDAPDWQRVLSGKVIPAISVMQGREALHAAAVATPRGVVAIMAPSGTGKTTLAVELLRRGNELFADDVLALTGEGAGVLAHPGTAHLNVAQSSPAAGDEDIGETLAVLHGERWMKARRSAGGALPVLLLCLLERGEGCELALHPLPSLPLALSPYILGISEDPERLRRRFELYADLTSGCPLVRASAGLEHSPAQIADLIAPMIDAGSPLVTAGAPL